MKIIDPTKFKMNFVIKSQPISSAKKRLKITKKQPRKKVERGQEG